MIAASYPDSAMNPVRLRDHPQSRSSVHPSNTHEEQINRPPCVTLPAPHWKGLAVINGQVTSIDLADYRGKKYVVLFFYSQDFSGACASEVNAMNDRLPELKGLDVEVIGCSTDSHLSHLMWTNMSQNSGGVGDTNVPLLSDPSHAISKRYGVYLPQKGYSLRAQFIIDRKGILRHMSINDTSICRGTEELIRLVKALQLADETEETLYADWKPQYLKDSDTDTYIVTNIC